MPKADSVLSTPPTNTPVSPKLSRRGFIGQAAVVAAGGAAAGMVLPLPGSTGAAATAPANPIQGPYSPALVDAARKLEAAHDAMQAASTNYEAADAKATAWEREHPQPKSRRGVRKWLKKAGKVHETLVRPSWLELLSAEQAFVVAQVAFAKVKPADERELTMMACHATIYDDVSLTRRNTAPISRMVALHLARSRLPGGEAEPSLTVVSS